MAPQPQPAPDEEVHDGPVTVPRVAATVIVVRGGDDTLEVLLVQRTPHARFMAGAWVFPGGAVGDEDGEGPDAVRAAAIRELREEAGIALADSGELIGYSRWITPERVKIRYDTWFFLAAMPAGQRPRVDGSEVIDSRWLAPADALAAGTRGKLLLVFPTMRHLQQLARFGSATALLDHARGRTVEPVQPRLIGEAEHARIVLPGEPGYDD